MAENKTFPQFGAVQTQPYRQDPSALANVINPAMMALIQDMMRESSQTREFQHDREMRAMEHENRLSEDSAASGNRLVEIAKAGEINQQQAKLQAELQSPFGQINRALIATGEYTEDELKQMPALEQIDKYTTLMAKASSSLYTKANDQKLAVEARIAARASADSLRANVQGIELYTQQMRAVNTGKMTAAQALEQLNQIQNSLAQRQQQSVIMAQQTHNLFSKKGAALANTLMDMRAPATSTGTTDAPSLFGKDAPASGSAAENSAIAANVTGFLDAQKGSPADLDAAARAEIMKMWGDNPRLSKAAEAILSVGSDPEFTKRATGLAQRVNDSLSKADGAPQLSADDQILWDAMSSESGAQLHMAASTMRAALLSKLQNIGDTPTVDPKTGQPLANTQTVTGTPYGRQVLQRAADMLGTLSNATLGAPVEGAAARQIFEMNQGVIQDSIGKIGIKGQKTAADALISTGLMRNFQDSVNNFLRVPPSQRSADDTAEMRKIVGELRAKGLTKLADPAQALIDSVNKLDDQQISEQGYAMTVDAINDVVNNIDTSSPEGLAQLRSVQEKLAGGLPPEYTKALARSRAGEALSPEEEQLLQGTQSYTQQIESVPDEGGKPFDTNVPGLGEMQKSLKGQLDAVPTPTQPTPAPASPAPASQPSAPAVSAAPAMSQEELEYWLKNNPATLGFAASYMLDPSAYAARQSPNPVTVLGGRGWDREADAQREMEIANSYAKQLRTERDKAMQEGMNAAKMQQEQQLAAAQPQTGRPMQQGVTAPQQPTQPLMPQRPSVPRA